MARKKKQQQTEETGFGGAEAAGQRQKLSPVDIQQRVFRLAFRGYNEKDVDEFLDHITEDVAALHEENKRLREQLGGGPVSADLGEARDQAEAIVREAREHAARLIDDAGGQAPAGAGGGGLSGSFLLRERDFLQRLAQSVQDHARWLKEEAQRQRSGVTQAAATVKSGQASGKKARGAKAKAASPGEATAAWGPPQKDMAAPSEGLPREQAPGEADPLLAAWESAFTGEAPQAKGTEEGEPSLKELFWGDE
ncbi:MAG: DivIVA domain-containing protein [Actinomycetota bacterium]